MVIPPKDEKASPKTEKESNKRSGELGKPLSLAEGRRWADDRFTIRISLQPLGGNRSRNLPPN
jgi:hypothetical protein